MQTDLVEIQNIPCVVCQECGQEQIGQQIQNKIDKLLERAAKGKLNTRVSRDVVRGYQRNVGQANLDCSVISSRTFAVTSPLDLEVRPKCKVAHFRGRSGFDRGEFREARYQLTGLPSRENGNHANLSADHRFPVRVRVEVGPPTNSILRRGIQKGCGGQKARTLIVNVPVDVLCRFLGSIQSSHRMSSIEKLVKHVTYRRALGFPFGAQNRSMGLWGSRVTARSVDHRLLIAKIFNAMPLWYFYVC